MKVDRYAKDLFKKLEDYNFSNDSEYDDDYYIEIGSEPSRFADYRAARAKITDAFGNKTYEDVWDSITQDESDFYLKMNLRVNPEDRYQDKKKAWYFHKSSWCMRHDNGYDGQGCNNGKCIPECRYYPEVGRIEDEEVIQRHKEIEGLYRKRNALI
ncbi:MAG TPA: hypothetical protein VH796_04345 [Nitrososphaeraceae archaeon]